MNNRPWTAEEIETLKREAKQATAKELAEMLNRSPMAIYSKCSRLGIEMREIYSDDIVEEARQLADKGLSYRAVVKRLNLPWGAVSKWLSYATR